MQPIIQKLTDTIKSCKVWDDIAQDNIFAQCKGTCERLFEELTSPPNKIPGLSLMVVDGTGEVDHTWIMAHHRDAGFFIIDPTIRQFVFNDPEHASKEEFPPLYIGSHAQLVKAITENEKWVLFAPDTNDPELIWTKVVKPHAAMGADKSPKFYIDETSPGLWQNYLDQPKPAITMSSTLSSVIDPAVSSQL